MPLDPLKIAKESLTKAIETEKRNRSLLSAIGPAIIDALRPVLDEILSTFRQSAEDIKQEISNIKIDPPVIPEIKMPEFKIPEIKVPDTRVNIPPISLPEIKIPEIKIPPIRVPKAEITVKVPEIKIPDIILPDEMNVKGWVSLMGVDLNNPLPVQLRDAKGNPVNLFENLTQVVSGGGGGFKSVKISGFEKSLYSEYLNADGRLKVSVESGGGGLTDAELRASSVPVEQVSGSTWSVSVNDVFRTTAASNLINSDDRLRVSLETGGSGLTDAELRATAVPTSQLSGATWSVSVNDAFRTTVTSSLINADDRLRVSLETGGSGLTDAELRATAVPVSQLSGANWSVNVTNTVIVNGSGVTQPVSATDLDVRDLNVAQDEILVHQVSGAAWSVSVTNTPAVTLSGALTSAVVVGPTVADTPDDGSAPVQVGGVARTANPTAVAANDIVKSTYDDVGRQIVRNFQIRDLILTSYTIISNGTETTLLTAAAGTYADLVYIMGANDSAAAVQVDIRAVSGGNKVMTLEVPSYSIAGVSLPVPFPQDATGNAWTADMPDITGTNVSISALYSTEI